MAVVYLVRHGQASFGAGDYDRLSDLGREQADLTGRELLRRLETVECFAHGTLTRQRDTAELCAARFAGAQALREHAGPDEFDHQEIILRHKPAYRSKTVMYADLARRGNPRQAFQTMFVAAVARWSSGHHDADYGETFAQFHARVATTFEELITGTEGNVVIASSGGVISALCADLLGEGPALWGQLNRVMLNGSITKAICGKRGRSMVTFNDTGHLERAGREFLTYR